MKVSSRIRNVRGAVFGNDICAPRSGLFRDERGVTTVAMVVSLFVTLSLIFSGAQLYRVHSASAEIQEVADVAALAAQNEIAEFKTIASICDAVLLSMGLTSACLTGVGLVAACIPPTAALSEKLIEAGARTAKARDDFYERAADGLNNLQRLLPFICVANAMSVARANDVGALPSDNFAIAQLLPSKGKQIDALIDDGLSDLAEEIETDAGSIRESARKAEEAAQKAQEAKAEAFAYDCGDHPERCMAERASALSPIQNTDNPVYQSVDAWSFSVGLARAQAYYRARYQNWTLEGTNAEERADSVIRKRFYEYAIEELDAAYIDESQGACTYDVPHLFRNTAEMRETRLYTESVYPITLSGESKTMHAWVGCPNATGISSYGSLKDLDADPYGFEKCPRCEFSVSNVGNVASATTSIASGFEYHYEHFRQALVAYAEARSECDPLIQLVKDEVQPKLDALGDAIGKIASKRIDVEPPGNLGIVCIVANTSRNAADTGLVSSFVSSSTTLGTRVAVSAATDIPDENDSIGSLVTGLVDRILPGGGVGGALGMAVGLWENVLKAYEDGCGALVNGVEYALNGFSQNTTSGLGKWAADALSGLIDRAGFAPTDTRARKPVLLNSAYPASGDGSGFAVEFMNLKSQAMDASTPSTGLMGSLASKAASSIEGFIGSDTITIAKIELPFAGSEGAISITVPNPIKQGGGLIDSAVSAISGAFGFSRPERVWQ